MQQNRLSSKGELNMNTYRVYACIVMSVVCIAFSYIHTKLVVLKNAMVVYDYLWEQRL
jgi:hypothetical protein